MHASEDLPFVARIFPYIAAVPRHLNGCFDPAQEDAFNHTTVKTLDDLAGIVAAEDFAWNVRVCKFTLSPANRGELPRFLRRMPDWFIHDLHRHSYQDGYARMTPYAPSHALVCAELSARAGGRAGRSLPARPHSGRPAA
jgi:PRTase ComF-like